MTVSRQTPMRALHLLGLVTGLLVSAPAGAQLLTMPPPAPSSAPVASPAPAPAPAPEAPAPAPSGTGSLFGAPPPSAGFQAEQPAAPGSLFAAPAAPAAAAPSAPASMFNSAPAPSAPSAGIPASCETQMTKFQERRQSHMAELDKIVKNSKNGKVDPTASCPKLRALASVETEMRNWMTKQQSSCGIPNEIMGQMREATGKTAQIAERACQAAADMKRQQTGAPGAGAPPAMKLPAGPL